MRVDPLYRLTLVFTQERVVEVPGEPGVEERLTIAEGLVDGRLHGRFRGAGRPRRRGDGTLAQDVHGLIELNDGGTILVELRGYVRTYPPAHPQVVGFATHVTSDRRFASLNDSVCAVAGEVRATPGADTLHVLDVAELVWEPIEP
ncbi:MAG TPA: hypothetical protein VJK66_07875 [Gaiellaceae bacterium]|nr:hypothetical protein [Gaiellaceae bacterium]